MTTSKPLSGILWTSPQYAERRLNSFINSSHLSFWAFIPHLPESDETKNHIHCYIVPSRRVCTDELFISFKEPTERKEVYNGASKVWTKSTFEDWYFYGLHDESYLESKGISKQIHYSISDFRSSSADDFASLVGQCHNNFDIRRILREEVAQGKTFAEFIRDNYYKIPVNQIKNIETWWQCFSALYGADNIQKIFEKKIKKTYCTIFGNMI